jgi:hypothetical protein
MQCLNGISLNMYQVVPYCYLTHPAIDLSAQLMLMTSHAEGDRVVEDMGQNAVVARICFAIGLIEKMLEPVLRFKRYCRAFLHVHADQSAQ